MKLLIPAILFLLLSFEVRAITESTDSKTENSVVVLEDLAGMNVDEFLALTPGKYRKRTGRRLSFRETMALKVAQKKLKKKLRGPANVTTYKSQITALFLVIFLGWAGIHRFYLGYQGYGMLMLLTGGGCMVLAVVDLVLIVTGDLQPRDGPYVDSLD